MKKAKSKKTPRSGVALWMRMNCKGGTHMKRRSFDRGAAKNRQKEYLKEFECVTL